MGDTSDFTKAQLKLLKENNKECMRMIDEEERTKTVKTK